MLKYGEYDLFRQKERLYGTLLSKVRTAIEDTEVTSTMYKGAEVNDE